MVDTNTVPTDVVTEDHRLEQSANKVTESLAKLRWHWTLDETNSDRVSFAAYGRAVGRSELSVRRMANGYAAWLDDNTSEGYPSDRTVMDHIGLQHVKQSDRGIVEAVAKANNTSTDYARNFRREDVTRVRNTVAERREQEPDITPEDEAEVVEKAAKFIAAGRKAEKTRHEQRRKSTPMQVLVVEGDLSRARDALTKALQDSHSLDLDGLDDEYLDLLRDAINRVVALAKLVQSALGNVTDVDWDAELEKISGGHS